MMKDKLQNLSLILIFIISIILVFVGQKNIGYAGLGAQLLGLAGLISILYTYNKRFK